MRYRILGRTDLNVSEIGLGTMMFGEKTGQGESIRMVHQALDAGVNLIDTADVYANGESERLVGLSLKGRRQDAIIATKVGRYTRLGEGCSRRYIMSAAEASLKRLQTDYIDLYQVHRWDPETPLNETLAALMELIQQGKVRYIGCSNFTAWQVYKAIFLSNTCQLNQFDSIQLRYNLIYREPEADILPLCLAENIGVLAYSPLGGGILTGKYLLEIPVGSRGWKNPEWQAKRLTPKSQLTATRLIETAKSLGYPPGQVAIRCCLAHTAITSVLVGPRTELQWRDALNASRWSLSREEANRILFESAPS